MVEEVEIGFDNGLTRDPGFVNGPFEKAVSFVE